MNVKDAFLQEYSRVYNTPGDAGVSQRKKYARRAAFKAVPEAQKILDQYLVLRANRGTPTTPDEILGRDILMGMATIGKGYKKKLVQTEFRVEPEQVSQTPEPSSPNGRHFPDYRTWMESNEYIPSDKFLAHVWGGSPTTYRNYRHQLSQKGWEITNGPYNGWLVVKRPEKPKDQAVSKQPDLSPEQISILMKLAEAFK